MVQSVNASTPSGHVWESCAINTASCSAVPLVVVRPTSTICPHPYLHSIRYIFHGETYIFLFFTKIHISYTCILLAGDSRNKGLPRTVATWREGLRTQIILGLKMAVRLQVRVIWDFTFSLVFGLPLPIFLSDEYSAFTGDLFFYREMYIHISRNLAA